VLAAAPSPATQEADEPGIERVDLLDSPRARELATLRGPDAATQEATPSDVVLTRELPTDGAAVVGLVWDLVTDRSPSAAIRFHDADGWAAWAPVEMQDASHGEPDDEAEGTATGAARARSSASVRVCRYFWEVMPWA